ncbi:hypothetical protein ACFQWF_15585 [Methylorubrum suomiense]
MRVELSWLLRKEALVVAAFAVLAAGAAAAWYLLQASVLTIAVAPRDGTEPDLIKAYADALDTAGRASASGSSPSTMCARAPPRCRTGAPISRWSDLTSSCRPTASPWRSCGIRR